jgi:4-carboxymuconolactone decarboxylase
MAPRRRALKHLANRKGKRPMSTDSAMWEKGLKLRREVLGADYVDNSIANANDFTQAFQEITTEWCWGYAWSRPGLDKKTRSMLNLAMLTALNRAPELKLHVRGALTNGVTVEEIKEILVQATIYCGVPAGLDAFKAANEVLKEMGKVKAKS